MGVVWQATEPAQGRSASNRKIAFIKLSTEKQIIQGDAVVKYLVTRLFRWQRTR